MIKGDSDASRKISILKSLSKEGFDIYKTDSNNDNILTLALKKGDKKLIEEILKEANESNIQELMKQNMLYQIDFNTLFKGELELSLILIE